MIKCSCNHEFKPTEYIGTNMGLDLYNCPKCSSTRAVRTPAYPLVRAVYRALRIMRDAR